MYYRQQIPPCPGYGFETQQEFSTRVTALASGREVRNGLWQYGRHRVTISWQNFSRDDFKSLRGFFYGFRGQLYTFLQRDWADYEAEGEIIALGDGEEVKFQLGKFYTEGAGYFRPIYAIDVDTFQLFVDGVLVPEEEYTLDPNRGVVVFEEAPPTGVTVSWSGEFFIWARFETDTLPVQIVDAVDGDYVFSGAVTVVEDAPPPEGVEVVQ